MSFPRPHFLGHWRRSFQWLTSLAILLVPFGTWHGNGLLRLDIGQRSLHLFGQVLRIQELYLLLFFTLGFGIGFLLITLVFGRVWCGWACPQTTLNDIAEWLPRRLGLKVLHNRLQGATWKKVAVQLCYLLLSLLVGANLVWYFVDPYRFFAQLLDGSLHPGAWGCLLGITLLIYLDLALVRRLMCSEFCPYGRFQTSLVDPGTLTLHLPEEEQQRCIRCGACVRACPMGIDIRRGFQIECINCGRCLDACREVMHRRSEPGLIRYSFGVLGKGPRALVNPRTLLLGVVFCLLSGVLGVAVVNRAPATLKLSVSHTAQSRLLEDGSQATFFNAWVNNRQTRPHSYRILARTGNGASLSLRGQTEVRDLPGGGNRKLSFVVVTPVADGPVPVEFRLVDENGQICHRATAQLTPP